MQELSFITPNLLPAPAHLRAPSSSKDPNAASIQSRSLPSNPLPKLPIPSRQKKFQKRKSPKGGKKPSSTFRKPPRSKKQKTRKRPVLNSKKRKLQKQPVPVDKRKAQLKKSLDRRQKVPKVEKGKAKRPPLNKKQSHGHGLPAEGTLALQAQQLGQKLGGRISYLLDYINPPPRNSRNTRKGSRPQKLPGTQPQTSIGSKFRKVINQLKPGRKNGSKPGQKSQKRPKKNGYPRRRKYPKNGRRHPSRKRPFKRENAPATKNSPPPSSIDTYGSPKAPAVSSADSYGAPDAPVVSDSYGAPKAPTYVGVLTTGDKEEEESAPPPPPPPSTDNGYESDLISSFRPTSEDDPKPFPTPDISGALDEGGSFEGTNLDNFDASVASFAEGISDFSGLSEQDVQTYNGYFTKERSDEDPVKNIKPFENYFEGSNSPTQQSSDDFFDSKQDNIRYYDEEGNLIDPDKLKSIDYQPDFFEFPEIDINRRVFETNDNSNNIDWKQKNGPSDINDNSNNIDWKRKNGPSRRQENIYGALENINRPKRRNQSKRKSTSSSSLPPSVASPLPVSISTKSVTSTPKLFVRTTTAGYNNLRYKGNNVLIFFIEVE